MPAHTDQPRHRGSSWTPQRPRDRRRRPHILAGMAALPRFDCDALFSALDGRRRDEGLDWNQLAAALWHQSWQLNAQRSDNPLCPGAVPRFKQRGTISCQYALFMLRWIERAPEDFLTGPVVDVGDTRLPKAGPNSRLRWNLSELHSALNVQRQEDGLTWAALAEQLDCTPNRLTNLRTARLADMGLAMRTTQRLCRPASAFIQPADW